MVIESTEKAPKNKKCCGNEPAFDLRSHLDCIKGREYHDPRVDVYEQQY